MITLIIKLVLFVIAGISKAVVDTIIHHGGGKLKKRYGKFFDVNAQGKKLPFTKYPFDGQHVFNSLMIISFCAGAALQPGLTLIGWGVLFIVYGVVFVLIFNLFWNKLLN